MYKLLLCWRYLRSRYIALASVISVTLGVATLIVVNSVMEGFTTEMQGRIHGILSDVIFESVSLDGMHDAEHHMRLIDDIAGQYIEGMSPTIHVPAMVNYEVNGQTITRPVNMIGIDETTYGAVGDFGKYLQHPKNREQLRFELRDDGYDAHDHQVADPSKTPPRKQLAASGWRHRRMQALLRGQTAAQREPADGASNASSTPDAPSSRGANGAQHASAPPDAPRNPFANRDAHEAQENVFDPANDQHSGAVLGIALSSVRTASGDERFLVVPGDDVRITYPTATIGTQLQPEVRTSLFTVVDLYESKMSEYDASFVFVPYRKLQEIRGMIHPQTNVGNFTSIQLKLVPGADLNMVRDLLRAKFPEELYGVYTWRDKQGPLLAAVHMETTILNLLLFLIIAVAGFGILAIFFMIVVEKTRDIGILKSLGASGRGVMGIFLAYGLSLGVVGAGAGLVAGLAIVYYINEIADLIGRITGQPVFDPSIYYFQSIPTIVEPFTIVWVTLGAMAIAVLASVAPARRAAKLHPVDALRYS